MLMLVSVASFDKKVGTRTHLLVPSAMGDEP